MEKKRKKYGLNTVVISSALFILILGISFSFFRGAPKTPSNDISTTTGNIVLEYEDCASGYDHCKTLTKDLYPGDTAEKTFTISNTSEGAASYNIVFASLLNTFVNDELVYKIEDITLTPVTIVPYTIVPYASEPTTDVIIKRNEKINSGETKKYKVTIKFLNLETDQTPNLTANYSVRLGIKA